MLAHMCATLCTHVFVLCYSAEIRQVLYVPCLAQLCQMPVFKRKYRALYTVDQPDDITFYLPGVCNLLYLITLLRFSPFTAHEAQYLYLI